MRSLGGTSSTYWFCTIERTSVKSFSCSYVALWSALLLATDPPSDSVSTTRSVLITKAFFMDVLSSAWTSYPGGATAPGLVACPGSEPRNRGGGGPHAPLLLHAPLPVAACHRCHLSC